MSKGFAIHLEKRVERLEKIILGSEVHFHFIPGYTLIKAAEENIIYELKKRYPCRYEFHLNVVRNNVCRYSNLFIICDCDTGKIVDILEGEEAIANMKAWEDKMTEPLNR